MSDVIALKKKQLYPLSDGFRAYLSRYDRTSDLPLQYEDLLDCYETFPLYDKDGNDTLWQSFIYEPLRWEEINRGLSLMYMRLKARKSVSYAGHLRCDRVEFCSFGNSCPFRIRIVNNYNDNHDYFYVKRADASRIFGLELEELLSPNSINFLVYANTLVEQHIIGIPGDQFIKNYLHRDDLNRVRMAKEFVKFNERSFLRLLGDMRSYNYVMRMTPDFDDRQYRVRAIDFDQQSYEGRHRFYLPQFFKENQDVVELCLSQLEPESIQQYRDEEVSLIARRATTSPQRLNELRACMTSDRISEPEKVEQLAQELGRYHDNLRFRECRSMGALTFLQIELMLERHGGLG